MHTTHPAPKAVAIFCTSLELGQEPITTDYYWEAYQDLAFALKDRGIEVYFTTGNDTYAGHGRFKTAYTTNIKVSSPKLLKTVHNVQVDLVFERSEGDPFAAHDLPVVNPESIRRIANNKIAIYQQFPTLQPYSQVVDDRSALAAAVAAMDGGKVVVKEQDGYGGDAVYIGAKADVLARVPDRFPLLVQEFIDTSMGVPGHKPGVHDIRTEICGGEITSYYIRMAKPGAYHSNVHQGGRMTFLPVEQVPSEVVELVRQIDAVFAPAPRFYAADFAYSKQGWKLIELNDYVGLARQQAIDATAADKDEAIKTLGRLADYLASVCAARVVPSPLG